MNSQPDAGPDGENLVFLSLGEKELLHFLEFLRMLLGEIVHLGEVLGQIIKLPDGF